MTTPYRTYWENPARRSSVRVLAPPLREVWRKRQGFGALPLVDHGLVFLALDDARARAEREWPSGKRSTTALSLETGRLVWRHGPSVPAASSDLGVLVNLTDRRGGLAVLTPDSGDVVSVLPEASALSAAITGEFVVAAGFEEPHRTLYAASLPAGRVLWKRRFESGHDGVFAATEDRVIYGTNGHVIAVDLKDGSELWRHSLADLSGAAQGGIVVRGDSVVLSTGWHVLRLDLATGRRIWACQPEKGIWGGYYYDNHYFTLNALGQYSIVDANRGEVVFSREIQPLVPDRPGMSTVCPPLGVSETHIFTGNRGGYLCAFERDTGNFVWAGRPKGGCSTEITNSYFVVVDEYLFYYDHSMTVYCMKGRGRPRATAGDGSDQKATPPPAAQRRGRGRTAR